MEQGILQEGAEMLNVTVSAMRRWIQEKRTAVLPCIAVDALRTDWESWARANAVQPVNAQHIQFRVIGSIVENDGIMNVKIFFDGACEPFNPGGRAGFGWIAYACGKCIGLNHGFVGEGSSMSNNVAEYAALIDAMQWVSLMYPDADCVEFRGDSNLVINQMRGLWAIRSGLYAPYARQAAALKRPVHRFRWIPREQNEEADALSQLGCDEN